MEHVGNGEKKHIFQWRKKTLTGVIIYIYIYETDPNNALLQGRTLKMTIQLHCLIPPERGNLMTSGLTSWKANKELKNNGICKELLCILDLIIGCPDCCPGSRVRKNSSFPTWRMSSQYMDVSGDRITTPLKKPWTSAIWKKAHTPDPLRSPWLITTHVRHGMILQVPVLKLGYKSEPHITPYKWPYNWVFFNPPSRGPKTCSTKGPKAAWMMVFNS